MKWIPVGERHPKPHTTVLFTDGELFSTGYLDPQGFWCLDINHESDPPMSVTHWMPLPKGPA